MSRRPWGFRGGPDELRQALTAFDRSGKGYINAAELQQALTMTGEKLNDEEIQDMMKQIPQDGEGRIKLEGEYLLLLSVT